ncbi:MAG: hypothetical protein COA90_11660 [Gammaproteobacteria bacterium]|nr:MAG: hypothetical protein COA90_11660 [Gammaproteobacteria bacterium]
MSGINENIFEQLRIKELTSNYLNKSVPIEGIRILTIAKEDISGDFHVVIRVEESIYLLIADGAGHGLSAVMPGLNFPNLFVDLAKKRHSILTIAAKLNEELCSYEHTGYFIALTLVEINEYEQFIEVLNCGNPAVLLINEQGDISHRFESSSMACGILKNADYELLTERVFYKDPGKLYLFTDGLKDSLIQSGWCENNAAYESLYIGQEDSNRFDVIQSEIEQVQSVGKVDDITLIEIKLSSDYKHIETKKKSKKNQSLAKIEQQEIEASLFDYRVLCLDPDEASLNTIHQALAKSIGHIDLCNTVEAAEKSYDYQPDLIIVDLSFLLKHQAELAFLLPNYEEVTPIIVTCEPSNVVLAEQLFSLCITRYLPKPLRDVELLAVVQQCAQNFSQQQKWKFKSSVFLNSSLAMTITDANNRIVRVNDAFCAITGYKREEILNCNPRLLSSGKHDAQFYQKMWDSLKLTGHWSGEIWNRRKSGELFLEWITINASKNEAGEVISFCSVFADVTERRTAEESVRKLSYYDELTDLPNRRLFKMNLETELKQADETQRKLAILFLDLDNFKEVNDTLGHDHGDLILKETALRLHRCLQPNDLIARMGGDEFSLCIKPFESTEKLAEVVQAIQKEMTEPFKIKGEMSFLSVSIGIAIYPYHALDVSSLLKNADQAMFYAKRAGRNCFRYFRSSMEITALERKSLIHDLRFALENKEFELLYQPIVEMNTGLIYKAEALIRWHHPIHGLVSPAKFIPIAEDTGLIIEIGNWVFEQAVQQSKLWRETIDENFQVSINKSPKQFSNDNLCHQYWLDYMDEHQCSAESIIVEITEGVLMASNKSVMEQLLSFRDEGVHVALDDFGTGYSSLAYLRKFDIDYIKIDRQFVQYIETSSDDRALCEAIIAMAHALGIKVIAEGVETVGQRDFLNQISCDYVQGFLFSKPVSVSLFEEKVALFKKPL